MSLTHKVIQPEELSAKVSAMHASDQVVFTNGCFDLLHPGHVAYLAAAKNLGDLLIVGINDDASVSRLKGSNRPINNLADRIRMLVALESVDTVISFSEDTPLELIKKVKPQILVKGGDYQKHEIVGAKEVEALGGQVIVMPFEKGYSSTRLIEKIKAS